MVGETGVKLLNEEEEELVAKLRAAGDAVGWPLGRWRWMGRIFLIRMG